MISEIKDLVSRVHNSTKPLTAGTTRKSTLTPAAAYFAFSAPFDESDDFIETENWSFAKYILNQLFNKRNLELFELKLLVQRVR